MLLAPRGKNSPRGIYFFKRLETAVGEKGPTGRRPLRRERARPQTEETLRFGKLQVVRSARSKDERGIRKGRGFLGWVCGGRA